MNLKTPITYYGGKQSMLKHILPLIPKHRTYTEAFAGGAAVYFAKEPCEMEVINDINGNLINFYQTLKSDYQELKKRIDSTLHSRREFEYAMIIYEFSDFFGKIDRAWAFWVLSKMSFAAKLNGSFGYDKSKNTMAKKIKNAKDQFVSDLSSRLEFTQIECGNALNIIKSRDTENTFHFVDPPYINSDCGHYSNTFNLMDFEDLLNILSNINGKFMLTMFPHEVLTEYINNNNWYVKDVVRTISASKERRRKQTELIVMNYNFTDI